MIEDIFNTSKEIFERSSTLCAQHEEERHKLANLLELIGHLVKGAAGKLRQGQVPATKIQQLEMLSDELYFRLFFCVGEIKARALSDNLNCSYKTGHQQWNPDPSQYLPHQITRLEIAAGYFFAAADQLHFSKFKAMILKELLDAQAKNNPGNHLYH